MNKGEAILIVKNWLVNKLKEQMSLLSDNDIIPVESPSSIENYKLSHPVGSVLVIYSGSQFNRREAVNSIIADRDLEFGVVVIVRDVPGKLKPEYYLQYIIDSLNGLKYKDELCYVAEDTFQEEVGGVWSYYIKLIVPTIYINPI